jgi:hypothetical protein
VHDEDDTDRFDRTLSMRRVPPGQTVSEAAVVEKRTENRRQGNARILIGTIIVIAVLHLARPVVVPVAQAVLFAFLLTPIVTIVILAVAFRFTGCSSFSSAPDPPKTVTGPPLVIEDPTVVPPPPPPAATYRDVVKS